MKLTQQRLEAYLLSAAGILRGKTAGQDYKNYILSLMFYKRLCDQWECEADGAILELERQQGRAFSEKQKAVFRKRGEHRFEIPDGSRWGDVKAASTNIGEVLTKAMRAVADANDELRGVFTVDWNQPAPDGSGKPLIPNEVVHALIQHFDQHDLSNLSVPPDVLGRAYEYRARFHRRWWPHARRISIQPQIQWATRSWRRVLRVAVDQRMGWGPRYARAAYAEERRRIRLRGTARTTRRGPLRSL